MLHYRYWALAFQNEQPLLDMSQTEYGRIFVLFCQVRRIFQKW